MAKYLSTKTYGNDRGFSCCFRQWRSTHSHCSLLHGYSIGIRLVFESSTLDDRNWVMDFGGLKAFKDWAEYMFDHTLIIARDDPHLVTFQQLNDIITLNTGFNLESTVPNERGAVCDLRVVEAVGCEKFAELAYHTMAEILEAYQSGNTWSFDRGSAEQALYKPEYRSRYPVGSGVRVRSVEVFEHSGNSGTYEG
jgi:6-pyruvoyltetrahydropterin/6-carboxytetrahydropterin synthase